MADLSCKMPKRTSMLMGRKILDAGCVGVEELGGLRDMWEP